MYSSIDMQRIKNLVMFNQVLLFLGTKKIPVLQLRVIIQDAINI